jgi:hypothetical protein
MCALYTVGDQLTHRVGINTRLTAFVDAPRFCCLDTFKLPFASEVRLELCKYAEHIEKCFSRCRGKRGRQAADYAACATGFAGCWAQFQGMSSSHRAAGQSAAIFPVTSAM